MPGLDYRPPAGARDRSARASPLRSIHESVRKASLDQIKKILTGEITNWSELGGKDQPDPCRCSSAAAGGVTTVVETELLDGKRVMRPQHHLRQDRAVNSSRSSSRSRTRSASRSCRWPSSGACRSSSPRRRRAVAQPRHVRRSDACDEGRHRRRAAGVATRPCDVEVMDDRSNNSPGLFRGRSAAALRRSSIASRFCRCSRWRRCRSPSIYFSRTTESAAHHLYGDSFLGVLNSTRLELLLANHRRIVESMPPEVDRDRLQCGPRGA